MISLSWMMFIVVMPSLKMEMHPFVASEEVASCELVDRNPGAEIYGLRLIETYCFDDTCSQSWATDPVKCEEYEPEKTWRVVDR